MKNIKIANYKRTSDDTKALWRRVLAEDNELRLAAKSWSWKNKETDSIIFVKAAQAASDEGVSVNRFIKGAKLCIMEDKKWTLANLMRYSRLKRADNTKLNFRVEKLTEDDLDDFDF